MKKLIIISLVSILVLFSTSYACEFDTDCQPGSICLITSTNASYGICVGGLSPGNQNDAQPINDKADIDGTLGDICQLDINCGIHSTCIKEDGSIYGTCL